MRLAGKVCLVTGAASGLGRGCAEAFLREGARVALADVAAPELAAAEELLASHGEVLALPTDVTDEASVTAMVERTLARFGRLDVLVCSAARFPARGSEGIEAATLAEWSDVMAVNARGCFLCCKAVVPVLKRQGGGRIVNLIAQSIWTGTNHPAYVMSKAAIWGLSHVLAVELGPYGVTVNAVAPTVTLTERIKGRLSGERLTAAAGENLLGRVAEPIDVVAAVVFLACEESRFITGQTLHVDGGQQLT